MRFCLDVTKLLTYGFCFKTKHIKRKINSIDEISDNEWQLIVIRDYLHRFTFEHCTYIK